MEKIIKDLIKYGKRAGKKNFTPGMSGNISARYGENIISLDCFNRRFPAYHVVLHLLPSFRISHMPACPNHTENQMPFLDGGDRSTSPNLLLR